MFGNSKTRQGYWNGTTVVTGLVNALFFGRLFKINDTVESLKHDGLNPEVCEVAVSSLASQVLPPERATVPMWTLKRSAVHIIGPA